MPRPAPRAFSAGVAVEEHLPETVFQMLDSFHNIFRSAYSRLPNPRLRLWTGRHWAAAANWLPACDIVIASDRARFGQPEIKLGVFPPVAAILLPRIMGEKKRARD